MAIIMVQYSSPVLLHSLEMGVNVDIGTMHWIIHTQYVLRLLAKAKRLSRQAMQE